nr:helix-turn-helix domain-containing protein [Actinomycetota bacterium]
MSDPATPRASGVEQPGERLRRLRLDRGLTLRELARRLEISPATVSAVENGRRHLSPTRLSQAAEVLDTRVESLLTGERGKAESIAHLRGVTTAGPDSVPADTTADTAARWRIFAPLELDPSLTAALAAFLEFGYHGATMRNIAQRAGLSVP